MEKDQTIHDMADEIEREIANPDDEEKSAEQSDEKVTDDQEDDEGEDDEETEEEELEEDEEYEEEVEDEQELDEDGADLAGLKPRTAKRIQKLLEERAELRAEVKQYRPKEETASPKSSKPPWWDQLEPDQQAYTDEVARWTEDRVMAKVQEMMGPMQETRMGYMAQQVTGQFFHDNEGAEDHQVELAKTIEANPLLAEAAASGDPQRMHQAIDLAWSQVRTQVSTQQQKRKVKRARRASTTPNEETSASNLESAHPPTDDFMEIAAQVEKDIAAGRIK